jgi:hypothetical protein
MHVVINRNIEIYEDEQVAPPVVRYVAPLVVQVQRE